VKKEELFEVMADIDEKYVTEAREALPPKRIPRWVKWGALAACVCICVLGGFALSHSPDQPDNPPDQNNNLPMLTLQDTWSGAMGWEGYLYHDFSEWDSNHPWGSNQYTDTLPVFKNNGYNLVGLPVGLSEAAMRDKAEAAAKSLGMEILEIQTVRAGDMGSVEGTGVTADTAVQVQAKLSKVTIRVEADGTVTVTFDDGLKLPDGYSMTYHDTSDKEADKVLDYLLEQYSALVGLEKPEKVLFWQRDIYGRIVRDYDVYESVGSPQEDLLNYCFDYVEFAPDDDGNLMLIRLNNGLSSAEKVGDYPIISQEEALKLLLEGHYATSVPYAVHGKESVVGAELVYRNGRGEQMFLPYYRFFVELSDPQLENNLKDYGAYYVPAVEGRFIENMPTYDGHFN